MYSPGVEQALQAAIQAHAGQVRKGGAQLPYVTHPIQVALLLARLGFDDTLVQAGLLHDVVEDCEGWTLARVEAEFGSQVRAIVAELSEDKSKSWDERKRFAIEHVAHMSAGALTVKAADKLHNLISLVNELEQSRDHARVWSKFTGGRERTLAMSNELVAALAARVDHRLAQALNETLAALTRVAAK